MLRDARAHGCELDLDRAIYFGARDEVMAAPRGQRLMPGWRRVLFAFMYRNGVRTVDRFRLPGARFIEVGRQIAL